MQFFVVVVIITVFQISSQACNFNYREMKCKHDREQKYINKPMTIKIRSRETWKFFL